MAKKTTKQKPETLDLAPLVEVLARNTQITSDMLRRIEDQNRDYVAIMEKQLDIQQSAFTSITVGDLVVSTMRALKENGFELVKEKK